MTTPPGTQPNIRFINGRPMQCKDIPDPVFITVLRSTPGTAEPVWRMVWNVHTELEATIGTVPWNLLMAKLRKLCAAGKVGGCPCGCRGDFHLPEECDDPTCCPARGNTA